MIHELNFATGMQCLELRSAQLAKATKRKPKAPAKKAANDDIVPPAEAGASGHRWTFLTNHSHVLVVLHANPDVVLRQVALEVGITERAVQRIIQDLEAGGFIERERIGRRNRYKVLVGQPLRHPIESHRKIGDLLTLILADR